MNAAVIGASSESIYAIKKARELGLYVCALDGDESAPGLACADEAYVIDIKDLDLVFKILDKKKPDVILPVPIGRHLITTGAVNDRYGLKGISYDSAQLCTDKYEFHEKLHAAGLRDAELYLVRSGEDKLKQLPSLYPVVVKPRYGSGSRGVEIYEDSDSLKKGFADNLPYEEDYIIESCIEGREYGVDGVFENGTYTRILLREKTLTPAPYRQCTGYYSVTDDPEDERFCENADRLIAECGRILGFKDNVVHADLIRTSSDDAFLIEISGRPSGHNLHNLFTPLASGVDEVTEFVKYALGKQHSFMPSAVKHMMIGYFDIENAQVESVPDKEQLMNKYPLKAYECNIKPGDVLGPVTDGKSLMGRGYFCLEAGSKDELDEFRRVIINEFKCSGL